MTSLEETRLQPPSPGDRRKVLVIGAVVVVIALVAAALLVRKVAGGDEERPEAEASSSGYLELACSLAASLGEVPSGSLLDGADGPHTTDLHLTAQLLGAVARLDRAQGGYGTLGKALDLQTTGNGSTEVQAQLRAINGKCGAAGTERVPVDAAARADYACAIGARLASGAGKVADVAGNDSPAVWELRSMNLLASSASGAPYDTTADGATQALIGGSTADQEEYDAGLAALASACSALEDDLG